MADSDLDDDIAFVPDADLGPSLAPAPSAVDADALSALFPLDDDAAAAVTAPTVDDDDDEGDDEGGDEGDNDDKGDNDGDGDGDGDEVEVSIIKSTTLNGVKLKKDMIIKASQDDAEKLVSENKAKYLD